MTNLVLVDSSLDITEILPNIKQPKPLKIISLDILSDASLTELGIEHEKVEDYLDSSDQNMIDSQVLDKTLSWYKNSKVSDLLHYQGINLGWLLENELPPFLLRVMKNFVGIIRIIQKENPSFIFASSYLSLMKESIDKNNKIKIEIFKSKKDHATELDRLSFPFYVGGKQFTFRIAKNTAIKLANQVEKITSQIFDFKFDPRKQTNKESILLLNINPNPYELFLANLASSDKDIVLLYEGGAAVWNPRNLKIVKSSGLKILHLNDFLSSPLHSKIIDEQNKLENTLKKLSSHEVFIEIFSIENYSFWSSIKQEFMSICLQRFKEAIERYELTKTIFSTMKIRSIVSIYNPNASEKVILHLAQQSKIPGFVLQHGYYILGKYTQKILPILFPDLQRGIKHGLWGPQMKDFLQKFDTLDKNDIILSGNPRYDQYFKIKQNCTNSGTILLASSFLQNYYEVSRYDTNLALLHQHMFQEICKISNDTKGKKLVIKLHPTVKPLYDVRKIVAEINKDIPIYKTQYVSDLMKDCDVLVTMDHSSILLEAMILDKPTIVFAINSKWYEDDAIIQSGASVLVRTPEEFKTALNNILFNASFRNGVIEKGRKFVNEYLSNHGNSSEYVAKILAKY